MLQHPNVIKYLDCGMFEAVGDRTIYYIATELAKDGTLRGLIDSFSIEQALNFAKQILQGLGSCHHMKIIHRDLKPENIFISGNIITININSIRQTEPIYKFINSSCLKSNFEFTL